VPRHLLYDRTWIGEIHDIDLAVAYLGRRLSMLPGMEIHVALPIKFPDDPGRGKAIRAQAVINT
jgi:hypothetical protein